MNKCTCIIHHPETQKERKKIIELLEYYRRVGDSNGIMLSLAQLGECKTRKIQHETA